MRMGKGPLSLIGVTTQEMTVKVWANGHHLCNERQCQCQQGC